MFYLPLTGLVVQNQNQDIFLLPYLLFFYFAKVSRYHAYIWLLAAQNLIIHVLLIFFRFTIISQKIPLDIKSPTFTLISQFLFITK